MSRAALLGMLAVLVGCVSAPGPLRLDEIRAVEGALAGVPVPEGSRLSEGGAFDSGDGVAMVFYNHTGLRGEEVLEFYDRVMPEWGWSAEQSDVVHDFQRSYVKDGVPIMVAVDKQDRGASFSILKGVRGDWKYMAPLRGSL